MRYNKHRSEQLTKEQSMYPYHAISSFGEGNSRRVHIVIQHPPTPRTTPEIHTQKSSHHKFRTQREATSQPTDSQWP